MTYFKSAYKNAGIHHKMVLLITALMLVNFAVVAVILKYVFHIYDNQMYKKTSEVLNISSIGIENELKDVEKVTFKVITDEQLQRYLLQLEKETSPYVKMVLRKKITNRLIAFAGSETYVYSMMVIDKEGQVMSAGNREGIPQELRSTLTELADKYDGSHAWYAAGHSSLLAARQFKSFTDSNFTLNGLGTLAIRVRIDRIVADRVQTSGRDGQLMITDGRRMIYPETPLLSEIDIQAELGRKQPYGIATYTGGTFFAAQIKSSYTGWTYLHITPFDDMFRSMTIIKEIVSAIFVIMLLIALALGARLSGSITQPIVQLIQNMRKIEKGDLDRLEEEALGAVPLSTQDEVGLLHRTYKKMIRRIRELINENVAKQLLLRETELKALQAQINPHFLYNTLESVNWLAKANKQDRISEMVEALAFLLRSTVSFEEQLIPLQKELDIVRSYVTIQKTRFDERLDFHLDVPEELMDAQVPKLTLQPLVENAIHYALEPRIEPCRITIVVRESEGALFLRVEDDGPGMTPDFLEKLRSGQITTRGRGIGLANIQERINLTFGTHWGIELHSESGTGTSIHVCIPYVKGDQGRVQGATG
ncbi:two-component sensor histidine kinase [Paenibacillus polymyxa]|nr:histidine kinase [Paenibacillus jamilae]OBA05387.1 two-component sensor histidine kinase [Paenibacillus polymyxa]